MACALLLVTALAACTSTVSGSATPADEPRTGATSATPVAPPGADQARTALIQPADLPPGWTPSTTDREGDTMATFAACLGARDTGGERLSVQDSPGFLDARSDVIRSEVATYPSQRDVDEDTARFADPRATGCFAQALLQADLAAVRMPSGSSMGSLQVTLTPGNAGGPANVVATATGSLPVTDASGRRVSTYIEFVFVTGRMTEVQLAFLSSGAPVPAPLRASLVAAVAGRAAAL